MLHKRAVDIIDILMKEDTYISIDQISSKLSVSNKTIRNDLIVVGEWLAQNQLQLIKKTGSGILISGDLEHKLHSIQSIHDQGETQMDFSPEARKIFIGMQLTMFENCRIYELSDALFVSRATIHKDIQALQEDMKLYKITLQRKNNNGLHLQGNERRIRNFMLDLMLHDNGYKTFVDLIRDEYYPCDGSYVFPGLEATDDEIHNFIACLLKANTTYVQSLTFSSIALMLLRLYIMYLRLQEKHYIELSDNFLAELDKEPFYKEARDLCDRIANHFHIHVPEAEVRYLQVYLLSFQTSDSLPKKDKREAAQLTSALIQNWEEQLKLPFQKDKELYRCLYQYLCPAFIRFRHGIPYENQLLPQINKLYDKTLSIVRHSLPIIEQHFNCRVSKDEAGDIALLLAASLERLKQPLQVVLVCHTSDAVATLIKQKLTMGIPELQIIRMETYFSIYDSNLEGVDLILSTIPLKHIETLPIIHINSLLHEYDISHLNEIIKKYYKKKNDPLNSR